MLDPLAAVLGVMPDNAADLLVGERLPSGDWCRRSLRDLSALEGSLQLEILRGALRLWKARCRAADEWWRSPAAESAVSARVTQYAGARARGGAAAAIRAEHRSRSAYEARMARKMAKREAKSSGPLPPPRRSSRPRRQTDHGPGMVTQEWFPEQSPVLRSVSLPWF